MKTALYNVRLEFDPLLPIGTLELPAGLAAGHEVDVIDLGTSPKSMHTVVLDLFAGCEIAVRSEKPIEFWRRVDGFTEIIR